MNRRIYRWIVCSLSLLLGCVELIAQKQVVGPMLDRTVLTTPSCLVNQFASVLGVGRSYDKLSALTDDDFKNYATVVTTVNAGLGLVPVVSVKNTQFAYKAGTTAGFSLVSGGNGGLLTLDVIKFLSITTYMNGERKNTYPVTAGDGAAGLNLELIKIPGSDEVSVDLTIKPQEDFDELYLEIDQGLEVSLANTLQIRYAFVGDAREHKLTYASMEHIGNQIDIDKSDIFPFPITDKKKNLRKILLNEGQSFGNENFDDKWTSKFPLAIGEWCHVQIGVKKTFEVGTEVGFFYEHGSLLNLNLGGFTKIVLYKDGKEVQSEVMDVSILKLGVADLGKSKTSIISKVPFDAAKLIIGAGVISVDLGEAFAIYYGFIREKPKSYSRCPINPSMNATICNNETTYELRSNPEVPVEWKITNAVNHDGKQIDITGVVLTADPNDKGLTLVSHLREEGVYTFTATSQSPVCTSIPPCTETITLTKGPQLVEKLESCGSPMINPTEGDPLYVLSDDAYQTTGSLISISNLKNAQLVLDDNLENYATYVSGLSLASNMGLIGIKSKDGTIMDGGGVQGDKRVGFIVENASTFLDADALQFLRIRLYRNGQEVYESVIDESNTIGVGLIGSEKSQKIRYSVRVPADVEFDEFQLWTSGVLNLGLNTLRIYYGFIESADANCSDPLECATAASVNNTTASLDIHIPVQLVSAVPILTHAEYLIDDDKETALSFGSVAQVGAGIEFHVKLGRTLDDTQQLVIVLDNKSYVANLNLGSWLTVKTFYQGEATGESFTNWETLGLNVIGYGDKNYLVSKPTKPYDEVHLIVAELGRVLQDLKLYGLFFRSDIDGDGIPDCMDPDCCTGGLAHLEVTEHLCEGEQLSLVGEATFKEDTKEYIWQIVKENDQTMVSEGSFTFSRGVFQQVVATMNRVGDFVLMIKDSAAEADEAPIASLPFTVHPLRTTWQSSVGEEHHWNFWDNWDRGTPWSCTDVIIPTDPNGQAAYPILLPNEVNACRYIHFEPGGEVVNTHLLQYEKAWVELQLKPNRYYMVSVPLKRIYSGDWFIPEVAYPDTFTVLDETTAPVKRVSPTIYQRVWDAATVNRLINANNRPYPKPGDRVDLTKTGWVKPFNWLATPYDKNEMEGLAYDFNALSVWVHPLRPVDKEEGDATKSFTFRFPKAHTTYYYYDEQGGVLGVSEQIADRTQSGRFLYEKGDSTTTFPIEMQYKNHSSSMNTTFLVGNPFMAHIDVQEFLRVNDHLASLKVYDGAQGTANSEIARLDGEGMLTATLGEGVQYDAIAPMQSFFVTCKADFVESCRVIFTEKMLKSVPKGSLLHRTRSVEEEVDAIRLVAQVGTKQAGALIHFSAAANDHYRSTEDAEILLEDGVNPAVALFSIADQRALDIQQRANGGEIPLGIYLDKPAELSLSVALPVGYTNWVLRDRDTDRIFPLAAGEVNRVELGKQTTSVGRFYLTGHTSTSNDQIAATQPKVYAYRTEGGDACVVRTSEGLMVRCEVYSIAGRLLGMSKLETTEYQLPISRGVHVVKVWFEDGVSAVLKVF